MFFRLGHPLLCSLIVFAVFAKASFALIVVNYDTALHNRFEAGFPTAPTDNLNPGFVGAGQDFSGVAWSTTTYVSNTFKGFAMLSPRHFLTAQHYETASNNLRTLGVRIKDRDGVVRRVDGVSDVTGLGYGLFLTAANGQQDYDLGIGALTSAISPQSDFARLAALDLNSGSQTNSFANYAALPFFLYGRGGSTNDSPRLASTTPDLVAAVNGDPNQTIIRTPQTEAALIGGDSASPALYAWTNPNGSQELTVLGMNSAVDAVNAKNFISFLPTAGGIAAAQSVMNPDGFALRLVGNPAYTWVGSASTRIDRNAAWGLGVNPNSSGATSDQYVLFDPTAAASFNVSVDTNYNLRGIYFKGSAGSNDGFSFAGAATLTLGRGGITVYDADVQTFNNALALGAPQYWSVEAGSIELVNLNTNGHLLEIGGAGNINLTGAVSGTGRLALSGGQLHLTGNSTYTGSTWAHAGTLRVDGDISSSSALTVGPFGTVSGSGSLPPVSGSGTVAPGNSPGILTAPSVDPATGLQFDFEFTTAATPDFSQPTTSLNDVLRLTAETPFLAAMSSANRIRIFLNVDNLGKDQVLRGGFFTDSGVDFASMIDQATIEFYLADEAGSVIHSGQTYSLYSEGPFLFAAGTSAQSADFGSGSVSGRIMHIAVTANTADYAGWKLHFDLTGDAALDDADDDADGFGLLLEYALGGDPTAHDTDLAPLSALTLDGGATYLELSLTRPQGLGGITYTPQTTTDLNTWPTDAAGIVEPAPTPLDNGDGTETLTYRRADPVGAADHAFMRIEISQTSP